VTTTCTWEENDSALRAMRRWSANGDACTRELRFLNNMVHSRILHPSKSFTSSFFLSSFTLYVQILPRLNGWKNSSCSVLKNGTKLTVLTYNKDIVLSLFWSFKKKFAIDIFPIIGTQHFLLNEVCISNKQ